MREPVKNLRLDEVLKEARRYLQSNRVPDASANAEFLLSHVMGFKRLELYIRGDEAVPGQVMDKFQDLLDRRALREPLPYLIGEHDFLGVRLRVTPDVLIPRPETEGLVKKAIQWMRRLGTKSMIDVGTGSGAIAITLARSFPHLKVYATEVCPKALKVARDNGRRNEVLAQVRWVPGDLYRPDPISGLRSIAPVDAIVSNPPYVARETLAKLSPEVQREPRVALDGGHRGIEFIAKMLEQSPKKLKKDGFILFEFGFGQGDDIRALMARFGFVDVQIEKDLQGIERYALGFVR